jgi:putative NADPH-quinone reductase
VKAYVVYCHPNPESFTFAVRDRAVAALVADGHQVRMSDLYAEGFEPAMSLDERLTHQEPRHRPELDGYCDNLRWCDALVFVYPTWWSGEPAMLTGWLDRVLVRGIAWEMTANNARITGQLHNIRRVVTITSHGSSKFLNMIEGEAGRRVIGRAVRVLCHHYARTTWLAMYNLDRSTDAERAAFLDRVERRMHRLWWSPTAAAAGRRW